MFKLIRLLSKWVFYLVILAVVLAVAGILLLDTIAKQVVQSSLRSVTGMDAKIGKMEIGQTTPTVAIEDLKIYNPPQFGGSLFLNMPEIYLDYDRDAIRAHQLHLNLVRINLAEIDIVQDKSGRLNIQGIEEKSKAATEGFNTPSSAWTFAGASSINWYLRYFGFRGQSSDFTFTGLDTLNVTLQKMRLWSMDSPNRVTEVSFGISNEIFTNLTKSSDFERMEVMLAARSSASATSTANAPIDMQKLLQQLLQPAAKK
jgi:hypothetical protein